MAETSDTKYGTAWSRDELILALSLYCQIPFAQTKAGNAEVIGLARLLGRTPSSVARKLGNFGAFDPLLAQKGIVGLAHYSKADRQVWGEFYGRWEALVEECQRLSSERSVPIPFVVEAEGEAAPLPPPELSFPTGPTVQARLVLTRLSQSFFRRAVLASYQNTCCVCGLDLPPLLVASHIKPWAVSEETRTDPENGLCLCVLHDKAYDRGLLSVTAAYEVVVSPVVRRSRAKFTETALLAFDKQPIQLPSRFAPKAEYLQWHWESVFQA